MKRLCIQRLMVELHFSVEDAEKTYYEICNSAADHVVSIEQELENFISSRK